LLKVNTVGNSLFSVNDSSVLGANVAKDTFQNDYFFLNFNDPAYPNEFNMLITDSVELPSFGWGSQDHFSSIFSNAILCNRN